MPGFDEQSFPFMVARNRHCISLINVKTGTLQPLIKDVSSTAWYQESLLVLRSQQNSSMRILYSSKECHSTPQDKKTDGEHHLVRELTLDEAFMAELTRYEGLLPTSMEQVTQIVSIKDE